LKISFRSKKHFSAESHTAFFDHQSKEKITEKSPMVKANNSHLDIFFYNDIRNSVGCFTILAQS